MIDIGPKFGAGVAALFMSLATFLGLIALWVWRHTVSLQNYDRVDELESALEENTVRNFTDYFVKLVENHADDISNTDEIDDAKIKNTVKQVHSFGTAERLHDGSILMYEACYRNLVVASLGTVSIALMIVVVLVNGSSPFTWAWDLAHGIVGVFSALHLYRAVRCFHIAREWERRFMSLTDEEDLVDVEAPDAVAVLSKFF